MSWWDGFVAYFVPRWALRLYRNLRYGFARGSACDDCPMCQEAADEHRTGNKLPDGSWEPAPYSDWNDANP